MADTVQSSGGGKVKKIGAEKAPYRPAPLIQNGSFLGPKHLQRLPSKGSWRGLGSFSAWRGRTQCLVQPLHLKRENGSPRRATRSLLLADQTLKLNLWTHGQSSLWDFRHFEGLSGSSFSLGREECSSS